MCFTSAQGALHVSIRMAQDIRIQGFLAKLKTSLGFEHRLGEETPTGVYKFSG